VFTGVPCWVSAANHFYFPLKFKVKILSCQFSPHFFIFFVAKCISNLCSCSAAFIMLIIIIVIKDRNGLNVSAVRWLSLLKVPKTTGGVPHNYEFYVKSGAAEV